MVKRYYTAEEPCQELGGAVALETDSFIAVRAGRKPPPSDEAPERSSSKPD